MKLVNNLFYIYPLKSLHLIEIVYKYLFVHHLKINNINKYLKSDHKNELENPVRSEIEKFSNNVIIITMICDPVQGWTLFYCRSPDST